MAFTVIPKSWFSWDFYVRDGVRQVAEIEVDWLSEKGQLMVEGLLYKVYREGIMSGAFILEEKGTMVAQAEKPNALLRQFIVKYQDREYPLKARTVMGREFILLDGEQEIGAITPKNFFTRRAEAYFLNPWPLSIKAFVLWLVIILWRREAND